MVHDRHIDSNWYTFWESPSKWNDFSYKKNHQIFTIRITSDKGIWTFRFTYSELKKDIKKAIDTVSKSYKERMSYDTPQTKLDELKTRIGKWIADVEKEKGSIQPASVKR